MHRFVIGKGPLLVLLHGVGLDHTMWRPMAERLATHHTVLAYDLCGHGQAPPLREPATLEQFTYQLWSEIADLAGPTPFALCGFSMGAMIAQQAAHERAQALSHLVLMCAVHRRSKQQRANVQARFEQARRDGPQSVIDDALARWFTPRFRATHPHVTAEIRHRLATNDAQEFLKAYAMFATADERLAERAGSIACTTLVTTGELDTGSTPAMMHTLSRELPNAEAHLLVGLAHMAALEDPDTVANVLADFLVDR